MTRVFLATEASLDIDAIWAYLEPRNPTAARRMMDRLDARFQLLQQSPESGEIRDDISRDVRQAIVQPYVIYYRLEPDVVRILRIVHGARNMPEAFHEPPIG
jgi:toxin ParE1/3/4